MKHTTMTVAVVILTAGLSSLAAATRITAPGFVIDRPGHYVVTKNLIVQPGDLPGDPADKFAVITIMASNVQLNLGGHSLIGEGGFARKSIGVHVKDADNVYIKDGSITLMSDYGIRIDNSTKCRVKGVDVVVNHDGILGRFMHNSVIEKNNLSGNAGTGLWVRDGNDNLVSKNTATENLFIGIWIWPGQRNHILKNIAMNNVHPDRTVHGGIVVGHTSGSRGAFDNVVAHNISLGHSDSGAPFELDLYDGGLQDRDEPGCRNTWFDNVFEIDNESGPDAGPGVGCIQ